MRSARSPDTKTGRGGPEVARQEEIKLEKGDADPPQPSQNSGPASHQSGLSFSRGGTAPTPDRAENLLTIERLLNIVSKLGMDLEIIPRPSRNGIGGVAVHELPESAWRT